MTDGGPDDDVFDGGAADDIYDGNGGNDTIRGFGGSDVLSGNAGDDTIDGQDESVEEGLYYDHLHDARFSPQQLSGWARLDHDAQRSGGEDLHGRTRALDGQYLHQAPVTVVEARGGSITASTPSGSSTTGWRSTPAVGRTPPLADGRRTKPMGTSKRN